MAPGFKSLTLADNGHDDTQKAGEIEPTWQDNVSKLFSAPYWLPEDTRESIGASWIAMMKFWGPTDLSNYDHVKKKATSIYQHCRSKTMPLTDDPSQYFPEESLELIRHWANQGYRKISMDPFVRETVIPEPQDPPVTWRNRKDIRNLTPEELQTYRAKLEDILGVGRVKSKWQELGFLHANWCLHYQEATFLWHRAYLRYVEELIDFPIPYWNGLATEAKDPNSEFSGLPKEFCDEEYEHPTKGTRPNPLRYALALVDDPDTEKHRFVERDPILYSREAGEEWNRKVRMFELYQEQIGFSLQQEIYSQPMNITQEQGLPYGTPWANIPDFDEEQPDEDYPYRADFDGLFEQPHDNIHGWIGPDMANNSFSGFDPVFLSYHGNIDRITEIFLRSRRGLTFTSSFPLRPFINQARELSYSDPREYIYTTIGDMAKNTKVNNYTYALPASPDQVHLLPAIKGSGRPKGAPYAIFRNVHCNNKSFHIDVFTPFATSLNPDPVENPHYIGRDTRLGMGPGSSGKGPENTDRCVKKGVTRIFDASKFEEGLRKDVSSDSDMRLKQVVTSLETGIVVPEEVWRSWDGFQAELVWGGGGGSFD